MKAEYAASKSKPKCESEQKAMYDESIKSASRAGFTNDAALGNELAGFYFARKGDEGADDAGWYQNRAREKYDQWGAHGKSQHVSKNSVEAGVITAGSTQYDTIASSRRKSNGRESNAVAKWTHGGQELIKHVTGKEAPIVSGQPMGNLQNQDPLFIVTT